MDESIDDFKQNFKLIKEKKFKLAQISKFLSPTQSQSQSQSQPIETNDSATNNVNSLKSKPSLSKLNETVKTKEPAKLKSKLKNSKSTLSNYFPSTNEASNSLPKSSLQQEKSTFNCPLCSVSLSVLSELDRQKHVNQCLDQDFSSKSNKNKFKLNEANEEEKPLPKLQSNENKKTLESLPCTSKIQKPESITTKDPIEFEENVLERQKRLNENLLKDAVPNCPICGKVLQTMIARQNHLKKCSQVFHIKTESLVELVKKQQEKLEKDLAKGLIPSDVYFTKTKATTKKEKISNRIIKLEQPINKQDENLQIAIAFSNSLNPAENCPTKAEIKLFKNKFKKPAETPLVTTDDETRITLLTTRLSSILENQIDYNCKIKSESKKKASLVKTKFNPCKNYLWDKCSYFAEREECFYVQIFLESGKFFVGHQLFIDKTNEDKFSSVEVVNTQTAFLLADLNDQTQENISVFYTQLNQTQRAQDNHNQSDFNFNQSQFCSNQNDSRNYSLDHTQRQFKNIESFQSDLKVEETDDYILKENSNEIDNADFDKVGKSFTAESKNLSLIDSEKISDKTDSITNSISEQSNTPKKEELNKVPISTQNIFENSPTNFNMSSKQSPSNFENTCIVDDTKMSSSSLSSCPSERIDYLDSNNFDEKAYKSNSNSELSISNQDEENMLDKNLDFIDETVNFDESNMEMNSSKKILEKRYSNESLNKSNESISNDIELIEENEISPKKKESFSKKRKSVDIIQLDDEYSEDQNRLSFESKKNSLFRKRISYEDNSKKPRLNECDSFICLDDAEKETKRNASLNFDINDESELEKHDNLSRKYLTKNNSYNKSPSIHESKSNSLNNSMNANQYEPNKSSANKFKISVQISKDKSLNESVCIDLENNIESFENNFSKTSNNKIDECVIVSSDTSNDKTEQELLTKNSKEETYLNESNLLKILNQTENQNVTTRNQEEIEAENEEALDEVWNNFDGNQFDDYYDYNPINQTNKLGNDNLEISINYKSAVASEADNDHEEIFFDKSLNFAKNDLQQESNKKKTSLEEDSSIDYDELELVLNKIEEQHSNSQKEIISPQNSEKTPACSRNIDKLRNKNLTKISNQHKDLDISALTPMPNYSSMDTPNLKENLKQFGIKPLSKKQAVKKLVEIYEFTHKHKLQRSQSCIGFASKEPSNNISKVSNLKPAGSSTNLNENLVLNNSEEFLIEQAARQMNLEKIDKPTKKKTLKKTVSDIGFQMNNNQKQPSLLKIGIKPKKNTTQKGLQECTLDDQMLELIENDDSDASGASPSLKCTQSLATNKKNKTLNEEETRECVQDLIKNDDNLYLSILNYEPVDYESFLNRIQLQIAPRKINKQYLMKILDEYCITFTLKNLNTRGVTVSKLKSKKKT